MVVYDRVPTSPGLTEGDSDYRLPLSPAPVAEWDEEDWEGQGWESAAVAAGSDIDEQFRSTGRWLNLDVGRRVDDGLGEVAEVAEKLVRTPPGQATTLTTISHPERESRARSGRRERRRGSFV